MASSTPSSNCPSTKPKRRTEDKPRRPFSAYNLYFQLERERIIAGGPAVDYTFEDVRRMALISHEKALVRRKHRKTHGKISFCDLARIVARTWKVLSKDKKVVFEEYAAIEKQHYQEALEVWKASQSSQIAESNVSQSQDPLSGEDNAASVRSSEDPSQQDVQQPLVSHSSTAAAAFQPQQPNATLRSLELPVIGRVATPMPVVAAEFPYIPYIVAPVVQNQQTFLTVILGNSFNNVPHLMRNPQDSSTGTVNQQQIPSVLNFFNMSSQSDTRLASNGTASIVQFPSPSQPQHFQQSDNIQYLPSNNPTLTVARPTQNSPTMIRQNPFELVPIRNDSLSSTDFALAQSQSTQHDGNIDTGKHDKDDDDPLMRLLESMED